jgi:SpoVK/Ycf46/Vps4 family AAA+-type ATPase
MVRRAFAPDLQRLSFPVVTLRAAFHDDLTTDREAHFNLVILRRDCVGEFIRLLDELTARDPEPKLITSQSPAQPIVECGWDDLILDDSIVSLLKEDFESFFERRAWFEKHKIPFRRGYLLHGPPGNGKTSAIRAMMTARSLPAYTMHFYKRGTDDDHLDHMFREAARNAPVLVLLEDIDRAFPRTGQSGCKISLQQLLNSLDGVATGEGTITVATANEPTALDPAILRRPGRFDRVVCFANPSSELRRRYFVHIDPVFDSEELDAVIGGSDGFSFAQLRETHIMAGQSAFGQNRDILCSDLLESVRALRGAVSTSKLKSAAGFAPALG